MLKAGAEIRQKFKNGRSPVFLLGFMVLFWTLFDATMSYATPLLIEERGFSKTSIGLIIGSSSLFGAIFDFLVCKFFKNINFRKIFLLMFLICSVYPLILWGAKTVWIFLAAMAAWGVYFDFYGFGTFDFVSRYVPKKEYSASFGLVQVFRSFGLTLAPLIAGLVIAEAVDWKAFAFGWIFLAAALFLFIVLIFFLRKRPPVIKREPLRRRKNLFIEIRLWKKLAKAMFFPLLLTLFLFVIESFFWTIGPLYAESANLKQFGGLFLLAFTFPSLIFGWIVGRLDKKIGKKRTAFFSLFAGSLILIFFAVWPNPVFAIISVFAASCFFSIALPSINSAYADYISEAPPVEGEIESLEDFSFNIGYIIGPLAAGILSDAFGISAAFSILGASGAIIAVFLILFSPKKIKIKISGSEI